MEQWICTGKVIFPSQKYVDRYGDVVRLSDAYGNEFIKVKEK